MFTSYISDAILLTKSMMEAKAKANVFWAQDTGFFHPKFWEAFGAKMDGIMSRTVFSDKLFKVKPVARHVNEEYKKRTKVDFAGATARAFTGMQAWAYVLNKAGSTDPMAIRKAAETIEVSGSELIVPWKGIKYETTGGETNQNTWSSGLIVQYHKADKEIVYPFDVATAKFIYPLPGF